MQDEAKSLDRVLSQAGAASRAEAARWIRAGRVSVNGRVVLAPATWVVADRDEIAVDGAPLARQAFVYWMLHKPKGVLTSRASDVKGRPTVYDLLPEAKPLVHPVGRLDVDSSGLLIVTNDSQLADALTNPEFEIPKTYVVKATSRLSDAQLDALRAGPLLRDGRALPARVRRLRDPGGKSVVEIAITEGRNRQVRRMLEAVGSRVLRLSRVSVGPLVLGDLPAGKCRALTDAELKALVAATGGGRGTRR